MRAYFGMLSKKNPITTPLRGDIPSLVATIQASFLNYTLGEGWMCKIRESYPRMLHNQGLNLNFLTIDFSINSAHSQIQWSLVRKHSFKSVNELINHTVVHSTGWLVSLSVGESISQLIKLITYSIMT